MDGKIRIIQLTGISKDIQNIITEFILLDLWNYKVNLGDERHPFIVVLDEAQNLDFSSKDSPCNKILKEGRKFGWSGWFATQFLKGAMKAEEINTLENASEKVYFHPTDNSIGDIAGNLSKDANEKKIWQQKLSKLNKGQCVVHGHLRDKFGEIYSANPVSVNISEINEEATSVTFNVKPDVENSTKDTDIIYENDNIESEEELKTKYIRLEEGYYKIYKNINGIKTNYGSFNDLETAMNIRDQLISSNWGHMNNDTITDEEDLEEKVEENIYKYNGEYIVQKLVDDVIKVFGKFNTYEEAIEFKNKCELNNWK